MFEPDEDGYVFSRDYLSYFSKEDRCFVRIIFDENIYHSSLAKAAKILNADLPQFFSRLQEAYNRGSWI